MFVPKNKLNKTTMRELYARIHTLSHLERSRPSVARFYLSFPPELV